MSRVALLFPGQGSQCVGMGQALAEAFPVARETFVEGSDAVGFDLAGLCFQGPAERLEQTEFTQPCVLTASVAAYRALVEATGVKPDLAAGHSLGEYTALVAAGALRLDDAVRAVRSRGRWMSQAAPDGQGGMAAVMGVARDAIEEALRQAAEGEVVAAANDNAPSQVVISGHVGALARAVELLKARGGKVVRLKVSGPFHTRLMRPAAEKMAGLLADLAVADFAFPVIANVEAGAYPGPESVPGFLVRQLTEPVRWRESVEEMDRRGIGLYIEAGPGNVLAGLVRRTINSARVINVSEPSQVEKAARELA